MFCMIIIFVIVIWVLTIFIYLIRVCWYGVYCKCFDILIIKVNMKLINVLVTWIDENELWNDGYEEMRSKMIGLEVGWWVYGVCDYEVLLYVIRFWCRYLG